MELIKISKFLSFILRHKPEDIGLKLDDQGWASVDELIVASRQRHYELTPEIIQEVVSTNNKKRFILSEDGTRIRANQGHTIKVDLGLEPVVPPAVLFHGTATRFMESIYESGLKPRGRHHVHMSADIDTAKKVGVRHGKLVLLEIDTKRMHDDGIKFYISDNGVWLTNNVDPKYFKVL